MADALSEPVTGLQDPLPSQASLLSEEEPPQPPPTGARLKNTLSAAKEFFGHRRNSSNPGSNPTPPPAPDPARKASLAAYQVQRKNLLQMTQLAIKRLIETGVQKRHQLDETHEPLEQFCVMLEHVMRHGLKVKKGLFGASKAGSAFWEYVCTGLGHIEIARQSLDTIRCIPSLQSDVARCRAWIRLTLMEKNLADYFTVLVENKQNTGEWYEEWGVMACEEGHVISGLLVGLSAIDANIDLKSSNMEGAGVIDFSQYLKDGNYRRDSVVANPMENPSSASSDEQSSRLLEAQREADEIRILVDQKHYAESLAAKLRSELDAANEKVKALSAEKEELLKVATEHVALKAEMAATKEAHITRLNELERSLSEERRTFKESMGEMETMYQAMLKQFETEMALRLAVEREHQATKALLQAKEAEVQAAHDTQGLVGTTIECRSPSLASAGRPAKPSDPPKADTTSLSSGAPGPIVASGSVSTVEAKAVPRLDGAATPLSVQSASPDIRPKGGASELRKGGSSTSVLEAIECHECHQPFSVHRRKQQCRSCKNLVCTDCAQHTAMLPNTSRQVKVCNACHQTLSNAFV
eukprot:comp22430_c0_seq1/m.33654 comp22430_c0_seq1/g.33654  ORF comp22430_c0_seq1/g.33654 comp22430_c0_seq1/m.33654 type:complete len:584 (-) comp22430_c0_seq1:201-1952(-)